MNDENTGTGSQKCPKCACIGRLIVSSSNIPGGFRCSKEYWDFVYEVFPHFVNKRVKITVEEVPEHEN